MENNNAKLFALQLGSLISLYISIGALITLLFGIITILFPDPLNGYWEYTSASGSMRFSIALLTVAFPTYLVLTRTINVSRRSGIAYLPFTKWLIYLSLLVGGIVLLGDLVVLIYNFLNGELTVRFILKALTVFVVVGSAFTYYVYDAREYWTSHESRSKQYAYGAIVLVIVSMVLGYMNIETPAEVREHVADDQVTRDLSIIQSHVVNYFAINDTLPSSLKELESRITLPETPEGRDPYTYTRTATSTFELCGEYVYPSNVNEFPSMAYDTSMMIKNPDDWTHEAGAWCFTRVVNETNTSTIRK